MTAYADGVADLAAALELGPARVCGLSFGGGLALEVYRRHPRLVQSLVLASAYAGWRGSLPPEEVEARLARARSDLDRPPATWIDGYLPGFFAGPVPSETVDLVRSPGARCCSRAGLRGAGTYWGSSTGGWPS